MAASSERRLWFAASEGARQIATTYQALRAGAQEGESMKAFVGAVVVAAVILAPDTPEVAQDRLVVDSGTLVGEGAE